MAPARGELLSSPHLDVAEIQPRTPGRRCGTKENSSTLLPVRRDSRMSSDSSLCSTSDQTTAPANRSDTPHHIHRRGVSRPSSSRDALSADQSPRPIVPGAPEILVARHTSLAAQPIFLRAGNNLAAVRVRTRDATRLGDSATSNIAGRRGTHLHQQPQSLQPFRDSFHFTVQVIPTERAFIGIQCGVTSRVRMSPSPTGRLERSRSWAYLELSRSTLKIVSGFHDEK